MLFDITSSQVGGEVVNVCRQWIDTKLVRAKQVDVKILILSTGYD